MRIAVTGKQGQVVQSLLAMAPAHGVELIAIGRPDLDLTDPASVLPALAAAQPDVIVSAAAYTAVDKAESEAELAHAVNAIGAGAVAEAASALGVPVIHLSTDYVFSGGKPSPYAETDSTGPISVYGNTKLEGELRVAAGNTNHVILRTAWVYSPFGANFVKTMLRLAESRDELRVVADQRGCPTSALDIAEAVIAIATRLSADADPALRGTFHLTGNGEATWAEFAQEIFARSKALGGKSANVVPITTAEYPTPARRPANSRLSGEKLAETYGIRLPDWKRSTDVVIEAILKNVI